MGLNMIIIVILASIIGSFVLVFLCAVLTELYLNYLYNADIREYNKRFKNKGE